MIGIVANEYVAYRNFLNELGDITSIHVYICNAQTAQGISGDVYWTQSAYELGCADELHEHLEHQQYLGKIRLIHY